MRVASFCFVALLLLVGSASAQSVSTYARITRHAVVLEQPRGDSVVLTTIPPGVVVELDAQRGDWYQASFQQPAGSNPSSGWIHRQTLEILPARAQEQLSTGREVAAQQPRLLTSQAPAPEQMSNVAQPTSEPTARLSQSRDGFWFNVGLGYGSLGCDNCIDRANGLSGGLSFGGTLSDRVLLGIGTTGWAKSEFGDLLTVGTFDARLRFYPARESGFFLTGGLGVASVSLNDDSEYGLGLVLGLGWDIRVAPNVSLTPFWNGFAMRSNIADANVGQVGIGITIH